MLRYSDGKSGRILCSSDFGRGNDHIIDNRERVAFAQNVTRLDHANRLNCFRFYGLGCAFVF
jgi:hypothetical protein